jgi:hypothetical protein
MRAVTLSYPFAQAFCQVHRIRVGNQKPCIVIGSQLFQEIHDGCTHFLILYRVAGGRGLHPSGSQSGFDGWSASALRDASQEYDQVVILALSQAQVNVILPGWGF